MNPIIEKIFVKKNQQTDGWAQVCLTFQGSRTENTTGRKIYPSESTPYQIALLSLEEICKPETSVVVHLKQQV